MNIHYLSGRCRSDRLGGDRNHARPLEPADQHRCGRHGRIPGRLLPQPDLPCWDDQPAITCQTMLLTLAGSVILLAVVNLFRRSSRRDLVL